MELYLFSDASLLAYGSCAYIRCIYNNGRVSNRLLVAKGKVAPQKQITLPKLELSAAVLSIKLADKMKHALCLHLSSVCFWTDSSIVLAWLKTPSKKLEVFVANRVAKILESSNSNQWFHVNSKENPANILSRARVCKSGTLCPCSVT